MNNNADNGVSNPLRKYRELPATPSYTPHPRNPLYDPSQPFGPHVAIQNPLPVLMFAMCHGYGCSESLLPCVALPREPGLSAAAPRAHLSARDAYQNMIGYAFDLARSAAAQNAGTAATEGGRALLRRYLKHGVLLVWRPHSPCHAQSEVLPTSEPMALIAGMSEGTGADGDSDCSVFAVSATSRALFQIRLDRQILSPLFSSPQLCVNRVPLKDGDTVFRLATGPRNGIAVANSGYVYCWGDNTYGQCMKAPGAVTVHQPIRFRAGADRCLDVAFGRDVGLLVFSDGVAASWGVASRLGAELPPSAKCTPSLNKSVGGSSAGVVDCLRSVFHFTSVRAGRVAAGDAHAAFISGDGSGAVYTWGCGRRGCLGHGNERDMTTAKQVMALSTVFVRDVACGKHHTMFLTSKGVVHACGCNSHGQLGLVGPEPRYVPQVVVLPPSPVLFMSAADHSSCFVLSSGDVVVCGGSSCMRPFGSASPGAVTGAAPVRVLPWMLCVGVCSAGDHFLSIALKRCTSCLWLPGAAAVAEATGGEDATPILSVVSGARYHSATLLSDGRVQWRSGVAVPCDDDACVAAVTLALPPPRSFHTDLSGARVTHLSGGPDFALVLDDQRRVFTCCMEDSPPEWLAPVLTSNPTAPQPPAADGKLWLFEVDLLGSREKSDSAPESVVMTACGNDFCVALTNRGHVFTCGRHDCCGRGAGARVHLSTKQAEASNRFLPPGQIVSLQNIVAVAAGAQHALALSASGVVYTWGCGALGTSAAVSSTACAGGGGGGSTIAYAPVAVVSLPHTVSRVCCGPHASFALTTDGEVYAWGSAVPGFTRSTDERDGEDAARSGVLPEVISAPLRVAVAARDVACGRDTCAVVLESGAVRLSGTVPASNSYCAVANAFAYGFDDATAAIADDNPQTSSLCSLLLSQDDEERTLSGLSCYGGWGDLCFIAEHNRPSETDVIHACAALHASLRST